MTGKAQSKPGGSATPPGLSSHEQLLGSEALLKQAVRMANLGHWVWDEVKDCCAYVSPECARMCGVTVEDYLIKSSTLDGYIGWAHPHDRARYEAVLKNPLEMGDPYDIEYRIIKPDGVIRHVREIGEPVADENGRITHTIGTLQDITEFIETQDRLKTSETRLTGAVRRAKLGYWVWDEVEQCALDLSEEYAQIFGLTRDEMLRDYSTLDEDLTLTHPDDREWVRALVFETADSGESFDMEYRVIRPDGELRWVRETSDAITKDPDGHALRTTGTLQDITELKETELRLAESEQRFRNLIEGSIEGIIIHRNSKPLFVNQAYAQLHGYATSQEILDLESIEPLIASEDRVRLRQVNHAHMNGEDAPLRYEHGAMGRDHSVRVLECIARLVSWAGGSAMQNTVIDVTDRKRAESERLTHARRQRDALVREVHHRIKNNLQGVVGLLSRSRHGDTEASEILDSATSQIRTIALVHGLQAQVGDETISAGEVIRSIAGATGTSFGEHVVVNIVSPQEKLVRLAEAEAVPLALVINELLTNACKHHRPTGEDPASVTVEISVDEQTLNLVITNINLELPAGFDFSSTEEYGSGLDLVKSLMPPEGATLSITRAGTHIKTSLTLLTPALVFDQNDTQSMRSDDSTLGETTSGTG